MSLGWGRSTFFAWHFLDGSFSNKAPDDQSGVVLFPIPLVGCASLFIYVFPIFRVQPSFAFSFSGDFWIGAVVCSTLCEVAGFALWFEFVSVPGVCIEF